MSQDAKALDKAVVRADLERLLVSLRRAADSLEDRAATESWQLATAHAVSAAEAAVRLVALCASQPDAER